MRDRFVSARLEVVFALWGPVELEAELPGDEPAPEWLDYLIESCGSLPELLTGEHECEKQLAMLREWEMDLERVHVIELRVRFYRNYFGDYDDDIDFELLHGPPLNRWSRDGAGFPPLGDGNVKVRSTREATFGRGLLDLIDCTMADES